MNCGQIKKAKFNSGFVQIPNDLAQNPGLSAKEKGIMLCLLSLPDDWIIYKTQLQKFFTDGRDGIISGFDSLIQKGYITTERVHDPASGQFVGYNYYVSPIPEIPETVSPIPEKPKTANPKTAEPKTANPELQRNTQPNTVLTNTKMTNASALEFDLTGLELPFNDDAFATAWESWVLHRKQIRKKLSRLGATAQLKKLSMQCDNGMMAAEWIIHSIASGYQGIYAPKNTFNNGKHNTAGTNNADAFKARREKYSQLD